MHANDGSVLHVSMSADVDAMASADCQSPATRADLRCLYDDLQRLLRQFKSELLTKQWPQLEHSLDHMTFNVPGTGNDAGIPEVPVGLKSMSTSASSTTSRSVPTEFNTKRKFSRRSRDVCDRKETHRTYPHRPSEQEGLGIATQSGIGNSDLEETPRAGLFSSLELPCAGFTSSRFLADRIERKCSVEASGSQEVTAYSESQSSFSQLGDCCRKRITSPTFDVMCGLIICFNAILVGIETEWLAQASTVPDSVEILQTLLNAWYMAELLLRLYASKSGFFLGEDRNWNIFDTILVASAIADIAFANTSVHNIKTARVLRAVRLFRIVRTLRIIRTLKYVREFRKMVFSLMSSIQTLFWSLLLVFGVMYSFALWFTQEAAGYKAEHGETQDPNIVAQINAFNQYYSSCSRTIYTLFAAIAGGYSWSVVVDPWICAGTWMSSIMFFVFISIAVFGLMNIVTSVFVESAMHATNHFQDLLVDERKKEIEMYTYHMERIFREIDSDGGGTISFQEMYRFLNDKRSELPQYLEALGISSADVRVLFRLLDRDASGNIDIGEFCEGCMRLKGEAKSFDINCLIYESRAMTKNHANFMEFVEERLEHIGLQLDQNTLELGKRVSMGYGAMMSKFEEVDRRFARPSFEIAEASLNKLQFEPLTPPTETIGASSLPSGPAGGITPLGVSSRKGVSHRERCLYATPRQAAANQPTSFTTELSLDGK